MKWRNSKERELLSSGGSRDVTLPNKNNPNPDLSDVSKSNDDMESNGYVNGEAEFQTTSSVSETSYDVNDSNISSPEMNPYSHSHVSMASHDMYPEMDDGVASDSGDEEIDVS